jgi:hypothetical protein
MAMRAMTRELVKCDAALHELWLQLHDQTWDPDELACVREDIDLWLERRYALQTQAVRRA